VSALHKQLREQQRQFANAVLGENDAPMCAEIHETPSDQNRFIPQQGDFTSQQGGFTSQQRGFTPEQRVQIYRNNNFLGLQSALEAVYPVVKKLLGDEFFSHLVGSYSHRYFSFSGNVHDYGSGFSNFVKTFSGLESLPYLTDVARLEWAYHEVFHATESRVLNMDALARLGQQSADTLQLSVSIACQRVSSAFPVLRIWQVNQQTAGEGSDSPIDLDEGHARLLVIRSSDHVEIHPVDDGVYALFSALSRGKTLTEACGQALQQEPECDVNAALHYLVAHRMVVGFSV